MDFGSYAKQSGAPELKQLPHFRINRLSSEGQGVVEKLKRELWVHDALVGEELTCSRVLRAGVHDVGKVIDRFNHSPHRVQPRCPVYDRCGGCTLQHMEHRRQIEHKQSVLLNALGDYGGLRPEQVCAPIIAEPWSYRRRARLGVKWVEAKHRVVVGFRERWNKRRIALSDTCEILAGNFGQYFEVLAKMIAELSIARMIPQIELAVADNATALVFRVLKIPTSFDLEKLTEFGQTHGFSIYLQPSGLDSVAPLSSETPELIYRIDNGNIEIRFEPIDFIQINADVNQQLVDRVLDLLDLDVSQWVLDLYCGIGNFSLPIARRAKWVSAVEGSIDLVSRASENAKRNEILNVEFHSANLDSIPTCMEDWGYADRVLLDPPRSGAHSVVEWLSRHRPPKIVYVACSPFTLARDAQVLVEQGNYRLSSAGIADMFPQTGHVESFALFERR